MINDLSDHVQHIVHQHEQTHGNSLAITHVQHLMQQILSKDSVFKKQSVQLPGHHILVCTHGEVDCRCGEKGGALYKALAQLSVETTDITVWEVSHVGGHKYAANTITYPNGNWHGLLEGTSVDAERVISTLRNDSVINDQWRGRLAMTQDMQLLLEAQWLGKDTSVIESDVVVLSLRTSIT